MNKTSY